MPRESSATPKYRHPSVIVQWGVLYGAMWSLLPMIISEVWDDLGKTVLLVLAGVGSGIVVTSVLWLGLHHSKSFADRYWDCLTLPLGAALYGFFVSSLHWFVFNYLGAAFSAAHRTTEFPGYRFTPMSDAFEYAVGSVMPPYSLMWAPLAVLTTRHFRSRMHRLLPIEK